MDASAVGEDGGNRAVRSLRGRPAGLVTDAAFRETGKKI